MANNFKITITAADKATATVRKVRDAIAQFTRPIRQVKSSIGALGRELGLDRVAGGLAKMARGAESVVAKVGGVVAAIAAVGGATSIAGIAALTREWAAAGAEVLRTSGILGIGTDRLQTLRGAAAAFGLEAADMTAGLKSIGDTMENALFGRDQQALAMLNRLGIQIKHTKDGAIDGAAGLMDLSRAIVRIKNVQAQGVVARTFGAEALLPLLQKGPAAIAAYEAAVKKTGSVQSPAQLRQAQEMTQQLGFLKLNIQGVGNAIMGSLAPALIPLIKQFSDWSQQNRAVISANVKGFVLGVVDGAKALGGVLGGAGGLINQTIGWKNAGIALAFVLGGRLLMAVWGLIAPVVALTARITFLTLTAFPRFMLAVAALTESAGLPALARGFFAVGLAADAALGPIGLALAAATALIAALRWLDARRDHRVSPDFGGRGRGQPGGHGDSAPHPRQPVNAAAAAQAMAFFQQQGRTREQAAGIVGNFAYESGLNPAAVGDGGAAYGIAQWHKARQQAFRRFIGRDIHGSTLAEQLRFAHFEMTRGAERGAGDLLSRSHDAAEASDAVEYAYERPSDRAASGSRYDRQSLAQGLMGDLSAAAQKARGVIPKPKAPNSAPKGPNSAGSAPAGGAGGGSGGGAAAVAAGAGAPQGAAHTLVVKFQNAPKGTTVTAKATGAAKPAQVRVESSMADVDPP